MTEVLRTAALGLGVATNTNIPFDVESYDELGCWAAGAPTDIVIPQTGVYLIEAWADISIIAGLVAWTRLLLNGAVICSNNWSDNVAANRTVRQPVGFVGKLTAADVIRMSGYGDGPVTNTLNRAEFRIARLR